MDSSERLAYCKNGDCVEELEALFRDGAGGIVGGPLVYIASFVHWAGEREKLILSRKDRNARLTSGTTTGRVFRRNRSSGGRIGLMLVDTLLFIRTFFALLAFRPDKVLCAPSGSPMWAAYLAARLSHAKFIHTRHAIVEEPRGMSPKALAVHLTHRIIRNADNVICHGPYLEAQLLELGVNPQKLFQFNLSYDYLHRYISETEPLPVGLERQSKYILFAGRMTINKGVVDLFEAARPSLYSDPNLKLVYAGDGPAVGTVGATASAAGLEKQVLLLGHVEHRLLPNLISAAYVVALPTQSTFGESRCKSAIESIVLGTPVIAPDFGPFPYVITDRENGLLFEPDSVADLQKKLRSALDDPASMRVYATNARRSGKSLEISKFNFSSALDATLGA